VLLWGWGPGVAGAAWVVVLPVAAAVAMVVAAVLAAALAAAGAVAAAVSVCTPDTPGLSLLVSMAISDPDVGLGMDPGRLRGRPLAHLAGAWR
jgi:hypothetical protein